jgi:MFS family permease
MNSGIVANKGFIHEFATNFGADGSATLASPVLAGWSSIQSVGQIVGMVSISFISSRFGRKAAMYTYWLVLALSIMVESLARSWPVWLVAKLLAGIGVGSMQSTLPTYIAEIAPVRIRGAMLMLYSLWWTVGTFFAYIAMQTMNKQHPNQYLTPIYTQWAQVGLMILIYVFLPESPAWCVTRGDTAKAAKALRFLNRGVKDYNFEKQLEVMVLAVEHEQAVAAEQRREHWYAIFRGTDGLRTVVALWTNLCQQFLGLTLFSTFGTYFFQQAGLADPFLVKCITSSINIATVIVVVFVADRVGRRWIACSATTLMWLSCAMIGILGVVPQGHATNYLLVLFACFWSKLTLELVTVFVRLPECKANKLRPKIWA